MIKAIIFDYDGVIVDSFPNVFKIYQKICEKFKVNCPDNIEEFRKVYGYNFYECLNNLGIKSKNHKKSSEIFKKEIINFGHSIFPDISEVIEEFSREYKLFLVTASYKSEAEKKLKKGGLLKYFTKLYCAEGKVRKGELMKQLIKENNINKSEIISIGDRAIDKEASNYAGIKDEHIILVTYGWGLDLNKTGKTQLAHNPKEILDKISLIINK
ncbi:MAG: HAD hydrolase-like protein [Patescibacteria group bacterium]|jgi:phosphoglycolate phosphatase|nr:HAD hydrolase-like protein [Patescibacteria group bacterium]